MSMMPDNWGVGDTPVRRPAIPPAGITYYTASLVAVAAFLSGALATASYLPPPMRCAAYETVDSWEVYPIDGENVGRVSTKKNVCKSYTPG